MRPHLLIVTPGKRAFREYLLRSISAEYRVHMVVRQEPTWERAYVDGWSVVPDLGDLGALYGAAAAIHASEPLDGVLCWDDTWVHQATLVAAGLGLPGDPL